MAVIISQVKFYADTPRGEKNKYFCFNWLPDDIDRKLLYLFNRGFKFRKVYVNLVVMHGNKIDHEDISGKRRTVINIEYINPKTLNNINKAFMSLYGSMFKVPALGLS